jgi:tetratricopeptide (TPR) repeat protein
MPFRRFFIAPALGTALALCGCVHTPPGTSVEIALARKAELYRWPAPLLKPARVVARKKETERPRPAPGKHELAARAFARGEALMKEGRDTEAIAAFEETVRIDPHFRDAWQWLAILYEKSGQQEKAMEAFRKAKEVPRG